MAREINMEVNVDVSKSETSLQELQRKIKDVKSIVDSLSKEEIKMGFYNLQINELKSLQEQYKTLNDKINQTKDIGKDINKNGKAFSDLGDSVGQVEKKAKQLKEAVEEDDVEVNETSGSFKTLGERISGAFENAGKKAKRFTLALFSVRTIFSVISKASSTYLSENEQTSNAVAGAWEYLGNVIGPVIERVVSWLRYGIAYLNVFLKALTGVDFLAKSIQKSTAKTNKELKKTISSMDEIVNLDLDSGSSANPGSALQDIANLDLNPEVVAFMEKLGEATKKVWDFAVGAWNFLEEHFGTTGAMAIVGGLALIIGGAGKGLIGVSSLLGGLATIGVIAIGVDLLYGAMTGRDLIQDLTDIKKGFDDLKELSEMNNNASKQLTTSWNDTTSSFNYAGMSVDDLNKVMDILNNDTDMTAEKSDRLTKQMEDLGGMYIDNRDSIKDTVTELEGNKSALEKVKEKLIQNRGELTKGTTEYNKNEKAIQRVNDELNSIDRKIVHAKLNIDISTNAASFQYNFYKTMQGIGSTISGYWNQLIYGQYKKPKYSGPSNPAYASGGFPETGQMFIANEKGPELVGNIGSSTAVVNNNQIVESVAQGVASAVSSVLVQGNNKSSQNASYIYINGSEFAKAIYPDMQAESLRRNTNTSIRRV